MLTFVNVIWGARCGKPARRVLLGETRTRGHAYSVRRRRESACDRKAPHRLTSSRLVSTNPFDLWAQAWRRKQADGDMIIVRFAYDIVVGFRTKADAVRFWAELIERMRKFSLELHPEKTRLLEFGPFAAENRKKREKGNRRRSTSSASPTSVGRREATDASRSCGRRFANGCKRS
jgi:hypothetical protein